MRAGGGADGAQVGVRARRRRPRRAEGLLLHLQHHRTLPRRHEVLGRRGRASPASATAASPAGVPDPRATAAELRRVVRAVGVAGCGDDFLPCWCRAVGWLAVVTVMPLTDRIVDFASCYLLLSLVLSLCWFKRERER